MKKILFVALDARFSHSNPALRSILASCKKQLAPSQRPQCELLEMNINQRPAILLSEIFERQADAVFFSCYIWNFAVITRLLPPLRDIQPDALIGLGGPEVEYTAAASLTDHPAADLVLCGEGETIFPALLQRLKDMNADTHRLRLQHLDQLLSELPGLVLKNQEEQIVSGPPAPRADLDEIPFLYEDFSALQHRMLYYESSRGCPFRCTYCLSCRDKPLRQRDLALVFEDLTRFHDARVPLVKWIDRSFNADRERARKIWSFLMELHAEDPCTRWHFELEGQLLEERDFDLLSQAPPDLFQFEIGIQSFNPEVLRRVQRSPETKGILRALKSIAGVGNIHCHADLIFGLPGEDFASCANSFRLGLSSGADMLQLGFLKILKGTPMMDDAQKLGFRWLPEPPYEVLSTDALTYRELLDLKRLEAVFERLWNGNAFLHTRALLLQLNEQALLHPSDNAFDSFQFFLEAGRFFYQHEFSRRSFSQDEFFYVFYRYLLSLTPNEDYLSALIRDYEALPAGRLDSFEKLLEKFGN